MSEREKAVLASLMKREDLAEKKTRIYARLLTDSAVVKTLEEVVESHRQRKQTLAAFLGLDVKNGEGMYENKEENGND